MIKAVEDKWPELKTFWLTRFKTNENGELEPRPRTVLRTLESLGTNGLSTHFEGLTSELVKSFQKAGYEYHVWTVDEIPQAKMLVEMRSSIHYHKCTSKNRSSDSRVLEINLFH